MYIYIYTSSYTVISILITYSLNTRDSTLLNGRMVPYGIILI